MSRFIRQREVTRQHAVREKRPDRIKTGHGNYKEAIAVIKTTNSGRPLVLEYLP